MLVSDAESCPRLSADGASLLGGCEDEVGQTWTGQASVEGDAIQYEAWGIEGQGNSQGSTILIGDGILESYLDYIGPNYEASFTGMWTFLGRDGVRMHTQGWIRLDDLPGVYARVDPVPCDGGYVSTYRFSYGFNGGPDAMTVVYDSCTDTGTWSDDINSGSFSLE